MAEPLSIDVEWVRESLACLHDGIELAGSRLAQALPEAARITSPEQRTQYLRKLLLDAIKSLRPTGRRPASASASRAYDCLTLRYISGFTVEQAAGELSLSPRQVYRDLRWGEEQLAESLSSCQRSRSSPVADGGATADALTDEIGSLTHKPEPVDLSVAVREGMSALRVLCERMGVALRYDGPERGSMVMATTGVLRELIVQLLSAAVQSTTSGSVDVRVSCRNEQVSLEIAVPPLAEMARRDLVDAALRIADAQGFRHEVRPPRRGDTVRLGFAAAPRLRVLVVEDNAGAYALYQRYLEHSGWEAILAPHPRLAGDLALAKRVQAVILDLMMAEASGWDVLQGLKLDPRTREIPVIVCSVLQDRELAEALGAIAYLTKPLARLDLLQALRQAQQASSPASGEPSTSE